MRRYFFGILAILLATATFAFTKPHSSKTATTDVFWKYNLGATDPLNISNYTQLNDIPSGATAEQQYDALGCSAGSKMCGLRSTNSSPTLVDDGSGFPDENHGGVEEAPRKQ